MKSQKKKESIRWLLQAEKVMEFIKSKENFIIPLTFSHFSPVMYEYLKNTSSSTDSIM